MESSAIRGHAAATGFWVGWQCHISCFKGHPAWLELSPRQPMRRFRCWMAHTQGTIPARGLLGACKATATVSNGKSVYRHYSSYKLSGWSATWKKKENLNELLTAWSRKADSASSLGHLFEGNKAVLNAANIASMLTQLSRLFAKQQRQQHPRVAEAGSVQPGEIADQFSLRDVRQLAEVMTTKLVALLEKKKKAQSPQRVGSQLLPDDMGLQETIQAASALARLGFKIGSSSMDSCLEYLLQHLMDSLPIFHKTSHFAEAVWAMAKLGKDPGARWIAEMLDRCAPKIQALNFAELGNLLWSLAKWGYLPGPHWMALFFRRCIFVLADQLDRQSLSELDQVAHDVEGEPSSSGQQQMLGGSALPPRHEIASLTSLVWGIAMLRVKPPQELTRSFMRLSQALLPYMGDQALSNVAWAFCRMDYKPPAAWINDYLKYSIRSMRRFKRGICFSNISWALANWGANPSKGWLCRFVKCSTLFVPGLDAEQVAVLLQGLADLQHRPGKHWVSFCLEVFHKQHRDASVDITVTTLWSISKLLNNKVDGLRRDNKRTPGYRIPVDGDGKATSEQAAGEDDVEEQDAEAGDASWGRGALGGDSRSSIRPMARTRVWAKYYQQLLQDLADFIYPGLPALSAPQLVDVLVAFADLGHHPGRDWLQSHERCCNNMAIIVQLSAYQVRLLDAAMLTMESLEDSS